MHGTLTLQSLSAIPRALVILIVLYVAPAGWAKVVFVNRNAVSATHDGATWSTAFTSVQPAIDSANTGDEVWVARSAPIAPAYVGNLVLRAGVALFGGFAGSETARDERRWNTNVTILQGTGDQNYGAVTAGGQGATIDGFTIRDAARGVYVEGGAALVSHCTISGSANGGIAVVFGSATVANCNLVDNGIGLFVSWGTATIENTTLSGNADGVYVDYQGHAAVANSIVAFNGKGIVGSAVTVSHNDVYGNPLGNYILITDPTGTNGNISQDPRLSSAFVGVHIQPDSPCIDSGDDSVIQPDWTDIDGQSRTIGAHVDIGSDESDGTVWTPPAPTVWYIAPTGNDSNDGKSWTQAKSTIGGVVAVARGSDEVWIAKGTYTGPFSLSCSVAMYGGFGGSETARGQRDWRTNATILDGGGPAISSTVATLGSYQAALSGFTIRNGIDGVHVSSGTATIADCFFSGNGICVEAGGKTTVSDCVVNGNTNGLWGQGTLVVSNCTIYGNSQIAVYVNGGTTSLTNCIVANSRIGIQRDMTPPVNLSHTDVYANISNFVNVPSQTGSNGNISVDPRFSNTSGGDLRLRADSPCIDAGDDSAVIPGETDLDGKPRTIGAHVDLGCYEYGSVNFTFQDAAKALRFAGGLTIASSADQTQLNVVDPPTSSIDLRDAVRIARKAAGLDANP